MTSPIIVQPMTAYAFCRDSSWGVCKGEAYSYCNEVNFEGETVFCERLAPRLIANDIIYI
jgi:hypothetical protein